MNLVAIKSILEIKTALMGEHSMRVTTIRNQLAQQQADYADIEASITAPAESEDCVANIQVGLRWKQSQIERLKKVEEEISETMRDLEAAEAELAQALAEERAIKRLMEQEAAQRPR